MKLKPVWILVGLVVLVLARKKIAAIIPVPGLGGGGGTASGGGGGRSAGAAGSGGGGVP